MIELGQKGRDKITGFEGTCTGVATYISGCTQVLMAPEIAKDGTMRDSQWFDQQRIEVTKEKKITLDNGPTPGPDRQAPKR